MDEPDMTSEEEEEDEAEGDVEGDDLEDEMTDVWRKGVPPPSPPPSLSRSFFIMLCRGLHGEVTLLPQLDLWPLY